MREKFRIFRKRELYPEEQKEQELDALIKASRKLLQHYQVDARAQDLLEDVQSWALRELINTLE